MTSGIHLTLESQAWLNTPVCPAIDQLAADQNRRHAPMTDFASKVDAWREEDREAGIIWNDEIHREAGVPNKQPASNQ